jgi:hypothetical protein
MVTLAELPGAGQLVPAFIVMVDVPVLFAAKVTLVGFTDQKLQPGDGQAGGGDVLRETVPLKLSMLVSEIVDVPMAPGVIVRLLGLAVIVNVGPGQAAAGGRKKLSRSYCPPIAT